MLLLACCAIASAAEESYRPSQPEYAVMQPAVQWTLRQAPRDWIKMKFTYAYSGSLARTRLYSMGPHTRRWREVGQEGDFSVYDFFDDYIARTQSPGSKPWTGVTIVIDRETRQFEVAFCYATPPPDDIQMIIEQWGC